MSHRRAAFALSSPGQRRNNTAENTLRLSSYLLLITGAGAVAVSGGITLPGFLIYLSVVAFSWKRRFRVDSTLHQVIFVALFVLFFAGDVVLTGSVVRATVRLLLGLSLFKLLTRNGSRDYLLLYLISFALLLIASTFTVSISYLVTLILFLFFCVLSFILFENREAYHSSPSAQFSTRGYLLSSLAITILVVFLAGPIFLAVPRGALGLFQSRPGNLTGFSSSVRLGEMGEILKNSEIVMRVEIDRPLNEIPSDLKWRGIALDRFDGRNWESSVSRSPRRTSRLGRGRYQVRQSREGQKVLRQSFRVEPFSNVIFTAPDALQVSSDLIPGDPPVLRDRNHSLYLQLFPRYREPLSYIVDSDLQGRNEKILTVREGPIPPDIRSRYLQLPDLDPRIVELSRALTREEESQIGKALLLERLIRETYAYSLANPAGGASDPLASFLFEYRAGHCEYFATAHSIMLRILGTPTRLVNGFTVGDFNSWQGHFTVRQSNAHSWVEAYFPGAGWIPFDPTPSVRAQETMVSRLLSQLLDSVDVFWTQLVTFDSLKQVGFFRALAGQVLAFWEGVKSPGPAIAELWDFLNGRRLWPLYGFLLLFLIGIFALRVVHPSLSYWWPFGLGKGAEGVPGYYSDFLVLLGRYGLEKRPAETPAEFLKRVREVLESPVPERLTHIYYRQRFGGIQLTPGLTELVRRELRSLRRDLRRSR